MLWKEQNVILGNMLTTEPSSSQEEAPSLGYGCSRGPVLSSTFLGGGGSRCTTKIVLTIKNESPLVHIIATTTKFSALYNLQSWSSHEAEHFSPEGPKAGL